MASNDFFLFHFNSEELIKSKIYNTEIYKINYLTD